MRKFLIPGLPSRDGLSRFLISRAPPLRLPLVPELFALGQRQLHLDPAILEVHPGGDQGQPLLLRLPDQLANLLAMHEQLPRPQGGMVKDVAVLIRTDVSVRSEEHTSELQS